VLGREAFRERLRSPEGHAEALLRIFAERLRRMDDLALLLAYGGARNKLLYALRALHRAAIPERRRPEVRTIAARPEDIAHMAGVEVALAHAALEWLQQVGACEKRGGRLRFFRDPATVLEEADPSLHASGPPAQARPARAR